MTKVLAILLVVLLGSCLGCALSLDVCMGQADNTLLLHPADCSKYIICNNGCTDDILECADGKHFNRLTSSCDTPIAAACDVTLIKRSWVESGDCGACRSLCDCYSSPECPTPTPCPEIPTTVTPSCPESPSPTTHIPESSESPAPTTPSPGTPPSPETPTTAPPCPETVTPTPGTPGTPPSVTPKCTNNLDICVGKPDYSNVYVPGSCQQYAICISDCATVLTCPNNLIYNLVTRICDYPQNVNCPYPLNPPSGPSAGPSGTSCQQHGKCEGQTDGTLFATISSTGYIICQCECEIERPCPPGLVFNENQLVCDYPAPNEKQ